MYICLYVYMYVGIFEDIYIYICTLTLPGNVSIWTEITVLRKCIPKRLVGNGEYPETSAGKTRFQERLPSGQ